MTIDDKKFSESITLEPGIERQVKLWRLRKGKQGKAVGGEVFQTK